MYIAENTLPVYATLEILQEVFHFVLGSDDLLPIPHKRKLTEV